MYFYYPGFTRAMNVAMNRSIIALNISDHAPTDENVFGQLASQYQAAPLLHPIRTNAPKRLFSSLALE